jgi:hypothetical protein
MPPIRAKPTCTTFFLENAKGIAFHFIEQEERGIGLPQEGHTHTHGHPHQKVRGCQTLQTITTTKDLALSSFQPRMGRRLNSEHQGRVTAIAKRHQKKSQLQGCPSQCNLHLNVPRRVGRWMAGPNQN